MTEDGDSQEDDNSGGEDEKEGRIPLEGLKRTIEKVSTEHEETPNPSPEQTEEKKVSIGDISIRADKLELDINTVRIGPDHETSKRSFFGGSSFSELRSLLNYVRAHPIATTVILAALLAFGVGWTSPSLIMKIATSAGSLLPL